MIVKNGEYQIADVHNCLMDTYNWIMDVHNQSIMDIHNQSILAVHTSTFLTDFWRLWVFLNTVKDTMILNYGQP